MITQPECSELKTDGIASRTVVLFSLLLPLNEKFGVKSSLTYSRIEKKQRLMTTHRPLTSVSIGGYFTREQDQRSHIDSSGRLNPNLEHIRGLSFDSTLVARFVICGDRGAFQM
jgi:hypothetical protein